MPQIEQIEPSEQEPLDKRLKTAIQESIRQGKTLVKEFEEEFEPPKADTNES